MYFKIDLNKSQLSSFSEENRETIKLETKVVSASYWAKLNLQAYKSL